MGISVKQARNISSVLSEGLPYIQKFKGKIIVVKYGGGAMSDQSLKRNFAKDILPETIINRSKRGLGYEFSEKNLLSKKWRKIAENYFLNPNDLNGFFSKKKLITSWDLFKKGKINANIIFKQFVVQLWLSTIND